MTTLIIKKDNKLLCTIDTYERVNELTEYYTNLGCEVTKKED